MGTGDPDHDRRSFLMPWRRLLGGASPEAAASVAAADPPASTFAPQPVSRTSLRPLAAPPPTNAPASSEAATRFILRPPGALPEDDFLAACEPCPACVEACPAQAIVLRDEGPAAGTPHIVPSRQACLLCTGLRCTHACPTGALRPLAEPSAVRMGTATIDTSRCTAYRGLPCRICFEVCPIPQALAMVRGERVPVPVAGTEACVGCGVCAQQCPAEGAVRIGPSDGGAGRVRIHGPSGVG